MQVPEVFEYTDYRQFLRDYYLARRKWDRKFSHRFISLQVGAGSPGWFSDVVSGRGNLSGAQLTSLVRLAKLKDGPADYFEALVNFNQASSMEEKNRHYQKLLRLKGVKAELIGKDKFEFYSKWYHSAIRELLFFHEFQGDYAALAKKLIPHIRVAEAKESIRLLKRLGFIRKGSSGAYSAISSTLKKDPAFKSLFLNNFLKASNTLGMESLERFGKEERDISCMTISLSEEGFARAREDIRTLREKLLTLMESDENPNRVFQCNFHMFPVTSV
jgi:uncharacterized protein (TIGR02147 family)